ncbi:MAG: nitroreductase family protein [Thaumarchaeota archaeon]|nr:nitroreductase family protein [Nitrososphaerota archaeon]
MQNAGSRYGGTMGEEMGFFELIETRRSVRAFKDKPLDGRTVDKILSAANSAPSARNLQSYKIFVVQKKEDKIKLAGATHDQDFIKDASTVLVFCADLVAAKMCGKRGVSLYSIQDATIACAYSQLASHALGLSSVWVGSFDEEKLHELFPATDGFKAVALLVIGFADEMPEKKGRKGLNEISLRI